MIKLATPVVIAYVGQLSMQLVDMIFVGRLSAVAVGGVALGTAIFYVAMVFGMGLLSGLDFLVAHAFGAGRPQDCRRIYLQALLLATLISIPLTILPWTLSWYLPVLGATPDVAREAAPYLRILSFSIWPTLAFFATRQYLQAMNIAKPAMYILLVANGINVLVNYILVFGHWGFTALGTPGAGWATVTSRLFMIAATFGILFWMDHDQKTQSRSVFVSIDRIIMPKLLRLGLPAAIQMVLEVGAFSVVTTLASRLGAIDLAAHQIVINTASLTFMVPMGISAATAVLVGQSLGKQSAKDAGRYGWLGIILGVSFMTLSSITFLVFPDAVLGVYTTDPNVIRVGKQILLLAALFQISDGIQIISAGALRGVADTRSSMLGNLVGHWAIGLPLGLFFCFSKHMGLKGLWIGLALGLTSVAGILLLLWIKEYRLLRLGKIPARIAKHQAAAH